jgi:hypothetical protein
LHSLRPKNLWFLGLGEFMLKQKFSSLPVGLDFRELLKTEVFRSFPLKTAYLVPLGAKLQGISKN